MISRMICLWFWETLFCIYVFFCFNDFGYVFLMISGMIRYDYFLKNTWKFYVFFNERKKNNDWRKMGEIMFLLMNFLWSFMNKIWFFHDWWKNGEFMFFFNEKNMCVFLYWFWVWFFYVFFFFMNNLWFSIWKTYETKIVKLVRKT